MVEAVSGAIFRAEFLHAALVEGDIDLDSHFHVVQLLVVGKPHLAISASPLDLNKAVAVGK